jgi:Domain of unknown function (DUF4185)
MAQGKWICGGFLASKYALGYRVVDSPVANMHTTDVQTPVLGSAWDAEDHAGNKVAQLYGGYVLPGSRLEIQGGIGLVVSQWHTDTGWPYRAMQFKAELRDTTMTVNPADPINLRGSDRETAVDVPVGARDIAGVRASQVAHHTRDVTGPAVTTGRHDQP